MKTFNHFNTTESSINIRRSAFNRPSNVKGTMPTGKLIPLYADEVLPGDTRKISVSSVIRGATPIAPVMDNAFLDIACFFVPNRLIYEHWEEFMGENKQDAWTQEEEFVIPHIKVKTSGIKGANSYYGKLLHTPIDYLNLIGGIRGANVSGNITSLTTAGFHREFDARYTRGMCKVWNDWYRNQNTQDPCHIYTDGNDREVDVGVSAYTDNYVQGAEFGTCLLPVNKFKDYFTSANPAPQKHAPITLPLGTYAPIQNNYAPVSDAVSGIANTTGFFSPLLWSGYSNSAPVLGSSAQNMQKYLTAKPYDYPSYEGTFANLGMVYNQGLNVGYDSAMNENPITMNLVANLQEATAVTVNQLRLAFQTQKFYEKQALYGSRYTEMLYSMFGVYSADARLQRAEFMSGKRIPIHQYQVNQTIQADNRALGSAGAFSLTNDNSLICNKSFTEHGILYIFGYIRTYQSYSQGQERIYNRRDKFDFYFPVFAHIGEQPILGKEIYYVGQVSGGEEYARDSQPFGYQEAWAEYRFKQNRICGYLRPELKDGSLAYWHYGNFFTSSPLINAEFTEETDENVKRTMAVQDDQQWIFDISFDETAIRPMPIYSVPGLIDHF